MHVESSFAVDYMNHPQHRSIRANESVLVTGIGNEGPEDEVIPREGESLHLTFNRLPYIRA